MGTVAQLSDGGPIDKDGYEGGESDYTCEDCGGNEFILTSWRELPVVVCTDCHKPQDSAFWGVSDE